MLKWIGGIFATVLAGVLTWWLTEGLRSNPPPQPPQDPTTPGHNSSSPSTSSEGQALQDFETVQAQYAAAKDCVGARRAVEHMKLYAGNTRLVPQSFQYSVRYPAQKPSPTISDLVVDRTIRLRDTYKNCF